MDNMNNHDELITVKKQALIAAVMEMERQETYRHFQLEAYIESLESLAEKLRDFLTFNSAESARGHMLNLFLTSRELDKIISDERIEQWEQEWKAELKKEQEKFI